MILQIVVSPVISSLNLIQPLVVAPSLLEVRHISSPVEFYLFPNYAMLTLSYHRTGPLENGEAYELRLNQGEFVARSGGAVNISAGASFKVNDAGGDVTVRVSSLPMLCVM